jgi:hypothetical protein
VRRISIPRPSPALVLSLVAIVIAGAGSATAAHLITGRQIRDSSITGRDVRNRSLTPADFRGSVRGRQGERGETGPRGPEGPAGRPRAYALVGDPGEAFDNPYPTVVYGQSRGFSAPGAVRRIGAGDVCLTPDDPGISSADSVAVASVDFSRTASGLAPEASAVVDSSGADPCPVPSFRVRTFARSGSGVVPSNNVAFTIIVS